MRLQTWACPGQRSRPAHRPRQRLRSGAAGVVAVGVALLLLPASPAHAHAGGRPPHAYITADDRTVVIEWTALADDAAAVAVAAGLLPQEAVDAYLGRLPVDHLPSDGDVRALADAPELRRYLLEHVRVTQDGRSCAGSVEPARDFISDGAEFAFTCPAVVAHVDVRITLLHDQDPSYRTFLVDGTVQTAALTAQAPEYQWRFDTDPEPEGRGHGPTIAGAALLVVAGAVASLRLRRPEAGRGSPRTQNRPRRRPPKR